MTNKENRIMKKLRSDVGASITFGLLLFLVCAVISAVVLVAGTTAAGRLSGMSKTEQRYYSVTSTAKLIQEELEGGSATVLKIDDDYYIVSGSDLKPVSVSSSVDELAEYMAYELCKIGSGGGTFDLELSLRDIDDDAADVDIKGKVSSGGNVSFTISSKDYEMPLYFSTNKKSVPVDISIDGEMRTGTKTIYNWDLSKSGE